MDSLIPIINQLQDVCTTASLQIPINLPQIVVVGLQSSGKSSVIESLVKREFLPRGTGIVTRRPLIIRLVKVDGIGESANHDYVKFTHTTKTFTDFDEVREEIERETDRLCGTNKGINPEPITLSVYSKDVINLTLVDLPGLLHLPVGDQPEDIELQIRGLVHEYISNPNSIILAVTAATNDFGASEATKLARQVDPEGKRTLVVLTKLDIMDIGTDAHEVLSGKVFKIRLGIIGVVNRSQQDIIDRKPIQQAIDDETKFLKEKYPSLADKNGQVYLAKRLSQLLMRHIKECLPALRAQIDSLLTQYKAQLHSYSDLITDQGEAIFSRLQKFSSSYCSLITGLRPQIKGIELVGGARIQHIFDQSFAKALDTMDPLEGLDTKTILAAAKNYAGPWPEISSRQAFERLVTDQIASLGVPSLKCVDLVYGEMKGFVKSLDDEVRLDLKRFPRLGDKMCEILNNLLDDSLLVTYERVSYQVKLPTAYINPKHPRLRNIHYSTHQQTTRASPVGVGDNMDETTLPHHYEIIECDRIARKIEAFFDVVRDQIKYLVPAAIMDCMVNHVTSNLLNALTKGIYHEQLFDEFLRESDDIAKRRKEISEMVASLRRATEIINSI